MNAFSRLKLKVCGMRDPENISEVAAVKPDYMGFIFYEESPRNVGCSFTLPSSFPSTIRKVGVFVRDGVDMIANMAEKLSLDYIQLHGAEDNIALCEVLASKNLRIIKAFSVDENFDFAITKPYKDVVDFFLFDTKGKLRGGNGTTFDWRALEQYDQEVPFLLSGGLNPENVANLSLLKGMNIHALDINSGVERWPGNKDIEKIKSIQTTISNLKETLL